MDDLIPFLAVVGLALVGAWIVRSVVTAWRANRIARLQADMQSRLLDKMGSAEQLVDYLNSDAGRIFAESATVDAPQRSPHGRILGSLQTGVILAVTGVAFFALRFQVSDPDAVEGLSVVGILGMGVGVGFLLAGALAWALSQRWGLLDLGLGRRLGAGAPGHDLADRRD